MRKLIVLFFLCLVFNASNVIAADNSLDKIEQSIFGFTYSNESNKTRLNRIEKEIYGVVSNDTEQKRISKLNKDLIVDTIGKEIEPKSDTFMDEDDYIVYEKEPAEAATMDYPVINELEQQVFKKEFKGENIKTRLSNLEKKTFNKTYERDDLSSRVDRLKAELKPNSFMASGMKQQENDFYTSPIDKMEENYHLDEYDTPFDYDAYNRSHTAYNSGRNSFSNNAKPLNLSSIEKKLYRTKYENESTSQRLSRIESSVFGTTFQGDSDSERIARISSAIEAQKTSKQYDSNKWSQHVATAVQIGTLILMVLACIL